MANEVKTDVVVTAQPKGFAKLRDETGRLNEEVRKGAATQAEGLKEATGAADAFGDSIDKALKNIMGGMRARDELRRMAAQIGDLTKEVDRLQNKLDEAAESSGAFFQGLAQGAGVGEFIQRGPGMGRQIAGRAIGGIARAPLAGAIRGQAGMTEALAQVPFGSLLALPFQFAQTAVGFQQQTMGAAPFLGGREVATGLAGIRRNRAREERQIREGVAAAMKEARAQAPHPAAVENTMSGMRREAIEARLQDLRERGMTIGPLGIPEAKVREIAGEAVGGEEQFRQRADQRLRDAQAERAGVDEERRLRTMYAARAQKALSQQRRRLLQGIQQAGLKYGALSAQDALQFATQIAQVGGGDPRQQQLLQTAISAQTAFGVGPETTGAFLRAGRRGGLIGGEGRAGGAITDALRTAITLGMEGSEINDFLSQIAGGITSWERTGIPVNPGSIQAIGQVFGGAGFGGGRLAAIAGGVAGGMQQIGREGPRSALDMLAITRLGGFGGGGLDDLVSAMQRMENLQDIDPKRFADFIRTLSKVGGGGGASLLTVRESLAKLGANINLTEAQQLIREAETGAISPERMKETLAAQTKEAGALESPKNLQSLAAEMIKLTPAVQRQSAIQNKQLQAGRNMVKSMQDLEQSSATVNNTLGREIKPLMEALTGTAVDIANALHTIAEALHGRGPGVQQLRDVAASAGFGR